jgi:hypothetical protein
VDKADAAGNVLAREMHYFYGDASDLDYGIPYFYSGGLESKEYETDRIKLETGPTAVAEQTVNTWAQRACGGSETNCDWIGSPPAIS